LNSQLIEPEKAGLKESVHRLLKWAWRCNKNLEEQAAQLHMLTGWSQIVEVSWGYAHLLIICVGYKFLFDALISVYENQVAVSRRMSLFEDCSQLLFE
jgi:nuclear pore complex protein Nup205